MTITQFIKPANKKFSLSRGKFGASITGLILATLALSPVSVAHAEVNVIGVTANAPATVITDPSCTALADSAQCQLEIGATLSSPEIVTKASIMNDPNLNSSSRQSLLLAVAASTVYAKHYSNFINGLSYSVTQEGTFYYDGNRVWVTQVYNGYRGSQSCFANYVVPPWDVNTFTKSDTGGVTSRTVRCDFNVNQAGLIFTRRGLIAVPTSYGAVTYKVIL